MNSYQELSNILDSTGFASFYLDNISSANYEVDYGKRKGKLQFSSMKEAAEKYIYGSSEKYAVNIDQQLESLEDIENCDLILQCIEVFDWGGVQPSNVINAINLYRDKKLKPLLLECKNWFECDTTLEVSMSKVIWSSGWTKVFSFMFDLTTIYDSRVAAYLNYIIIVFYNSLSDEADKQAFKSITRKLVSFKGNGSRTRCLNRSTRTTLGIRMATNKHHNFVANKVASWLLRYICELEYGNQSQECFREIDKAVFMLGFDIDQIDKNADFE